MQIRNGIAFGLEIGGSPWSSAGSLWPEREGMIHIVRSETGTLNFLRGEIFGELVDNGTDDFEVGQFVVPFRMEIIKSLYFRGILGFMVSSKFALLRSPFLFFFNFLYSIDSTKSFKRRFLSEIDKSQ